MNTNDNQTSLPEEDFIQQTPGQLIRDAREAKKISINEVVHKLLLSKQIVAALEEDNYSRIPAQVYAEGYLKAYAQFLQIPVATILASFRRLNIYSNTEQLAKHESTPKNYQQFLNTIQKSPIRFLFYGILGVVVFSTFLFFIARLFSGHIPENSIKPTQNKDMNIETTATDTDKVASETEPKDTK